MNALLRMPIHLKDIIFSGAAFPGAAFLGALTLSLREIMNSLGLAQVKHST